MLARTILDIFFVSFYRNEHMDNSDKIMLIKRFVSAE